MQEIRAAAKIETWPRNGMRHSFGSYHLALHDDINATIGSMGHSTRETLFKHYRRATTKQAARAYFAIKPAA